MEFEMRDLTGLVMELADFPGLDKSVARITETARWLFEADDAGITLIRGKRLETVGPTQLVALRADELQYEWREGPCVDAATEQQLVMSDDPAGDSRWPRWGPAISGLGIRSVLAADLTTENRRFGALNLYGHRHEQFAHLDHDELRLFAHHVTASLAAAKAIDSLETALVQRTVIGRAEGILMERFSIDAVAAFAVLKRASQQSNVKIGEIARLLADEGDDSYIRGDDR
ncbi:GAF and ANTAR domain-containing protein [Aeromicrobium sp. YIM 150415]|uniref:GAF and ANTAR domain-containing protein n=1 Tax=Aeromicrobium sp. YIM 150415 TaxID=2803912 RepID=UPI0019660725|nr:GAF and ANTAR domain-containing protein [Aeromicrobium sp. YIM 150415]MBM9465339.1 GAF and ANTAR domain-containing protein [Aeromicrobium sp. YIM 150415]